jgi:hypothetical protein
MVSYTALLLQGRLLHVLLCEIRIFRVVPRGTMGLVRYWGCGLSFSSPWDYATVVQGSIVQL